MAPYGANSSTVQYSLYGICNHMGIKTILDFVEITMLIIILCVCLKLGSTAGGHYVAVCKHPVTRKWHEFNDNM